MKNNFISCNIFIFCVVAVLLRVFWPDLDPVIFLRVDTGSGFACGSDPNSANHRTDPQH